MSSVLFISPGFHNYDKVIAREIENKGYEVTTFIPAGHYSTLEKLLNAVSGGKLLKRKILRRQVEFLLYSKKKYDYVFVIVGRNLNPRVFHKFRKMQPNAKFVLYLWDDIERVENFNKNRNCYDEIFSFDLSDVEKYNVKHLPLFYTREHMYCGEKKIYSLNMSGMLHSDRLSVWEKVVTAAELSEKDCYLYLMGTEMNHFIRSVFFRDSIWMKPKYIHIYGMGLDKIADGMKHSFAALDIPHSSQNGLSMRTIEAIAANVKLITTNEYVKKYDFYEYGNICVIDRDKPQIPKDFFEVEYKPLPGDILKKYSIEYWLNTIFHFD